jgi:hypothetical protein
MPKLFDLGGKRAGPALAEAPVDYTGHLPRRGPHESAPVNGWITSRVLMVEQPVILDEQHGVDDQWRDRPKISVGQSRIAGAVEDIPIAIEELQPGTGFLVVNRVAALVDEALERGRPLRLAGDAEMPGGQRKR